MVCVNQKYKACMHCLRVSMEVKGGTKEGKGGTKEGKGALRRARV